MTLFAISSWFIRLKVFGNFARTPLLARVHHSSHDSEGLGLTLLHPLCVVSMITGGNQTTKQAVPQSCPYKYTTRRSPHFFMRSPLRVRQGRTHPERLVFAFLCILMAAPGLLTTSELYIFSSCRINIMLSWFYSILATMNIHNIKDKNGTEISRTEPYRFIYLIQSNPYFFCSTLPFSLSHLRCFVFQM